MKKAIEGNDRAIQTLIKLDEDLEAEISANAANQNGAAEPDPIGLDDNEILAAFEAMVRETAVTEKPRVKKGKRDVDDA